MVENTCDSHRTEHAPLSPRQLRRPTQANEEDEAMSDKRQAAPSWNGSILIDAHDAAPTITMMMMMSTC